MTRTTKTRVGGRLAATAIVALTLVLVNLSPTARAGATIGADLSVGTYTSTRYDRNLGGIALNGTNDDFATDPFTNSRWQKSGLPANCISYNAAGQNVRIGDITDSLNCGASGRIRTVATFTLTHVQSFTMDFRAIFDETVGATGGPNDVLFGLGSTGESGGDQANDFAGMDALIDFTNNCVKMRGYFRQGGGVFQQFGTTTACTLSFGVAYQGRVTYVADNRTLLLVLGTLQTSDTVLQAGKTFTVNRPYIWSQDTFFERVTVDDVFRVMAPTGNYITANLVAGGDGDVLAAIAVDTASTSAADYVDAVYLLNSLGTTIATYLPDITTNGETIITEGTLSSGAFGGLGGSQIQVRVNLTSGGGASPVVTALWVVTNTGGGGVGGPPGGFPPPTTIPDFIRDKLLTPAIAAAQALCDLWLIALLLALVAVALVVRHMKRSGDTTT